MWFGAVAEMLAQLALAQLLPTPYFLHSHDPTVWQLVSPVSIVFAGILSMCKESFIFSWTGLAALSSTMVPSQST